MPSGTSYPLGETYRADYARRETRIRGGLRKVLNNILVIITSDPKARMRWSVKAYCKFVFIRYRLRLVGWPHDVVFANLSKVTGYERISRLFALWESGLPRNWGRNDIGKRRRRPKTNPDGNRSYRCVRDGPKTPRLVSAAADARADKEYIEGLIAAKDRDESGGLAWEA
ncbi:hypothetical protein LXA43DRAFT_1113043 [Ganoderma leucocontextum]|nr:hypothetical protein LXA43DRAFT_1113043 [Ganoderma leucocontextum]